jgi:FKBP-type peptidyl-prolyl cis-trans isomerase
MNKFWFTLAGLSLLAAPLTAQQITLKDDKDKLSYSLGLNIGNSLKSEEIDLNPEVLAEALKHVFSGAKPLLTEEEAQQTLMNYAMRRHAQDAEKAREVGAKNKKEGAEFLAKNGKATGVKTLPSGLQYKVLKDARGQKPKSSDVVKVHYKGTFIDGKVFDSSYERNDPVTFPVDQVIDGWKEGLPLMTVGSKYQFFVPSDLAYGESGRPGIPPNSVLVFEVELLGIETAAK